MNSTFVNETVVAVKVAFEHEIRRVSFTGNTFSALRDIVAALFSLDKENIVIKYKDDAGDLITMSLDSEVQEAIQLAVAKSTNKILRLFVAKGNPAPTALPAPPTPITETSKCAEKKQEWKAKHEAFRQEMQETRAALFAAKEAGDFQLVKEHRAKLHEMRERRQARLEARQQSSLTPALSPTPAPAIARAPEAEVQHVRNLALHQERKATRMALEGAKQAGNMQQVEMLREKLQELRQQCGMNPDHQQRIAFRDEMQGLRASVFEAKERGDWETVKELRAKMHALRESHAPNHGKKCGVQFRFRGAIPVPAPTLTPTGAVSTASEPVATPTPAPAHWIRQGACVPVNPERRAMWETFRKERQELRAALLTAKANGDLQAEKELEAKLHELRENHQTKLGRRPAPTPFSGVATLPAPTMCGGANTNERCVNGKEACKQRKEMWEGIRQQRQELRSNLFAAQQSGDAQAVAEAKQKLKEFRERVGQAKLGQPQMLVRHFRPHLHHHHHMLFPAQPMTPASPAPVPAPTPESPATAYAPVTPGYAATPVPPTTSANPATPVIVQHVPMMRTHFRLRHPRFLPAHALTPATAPAPASPASPAPAYAAPATPATPAYTAPATPATPASAPMPAVVPLHTHFRFAHRHPGAIRKNFAG